MFCQRCGVRAPIIETRNANNRVIRLHECKKCKTQFATVEDYIYGAEALKLLKEGRINAKRKKEY